MPAVAPQDPVLPRAEALRALGHHEGTRFVAHTLREWMVRTGHVAHGLPELSTTRLGTLPAPITATTSEP